MLVIITSVAFSYERYIGSLPPGALVPIVVIAALIAAPTFYRKMERKNWLADQLSILSNRDLFNIGVLCIAVVVVLALLGWAWIKIYSIS